MLAKRLCLPSAKSLILQWFKWPPVSRLKLHFRIAGPLFAKFFPISLRISRGFIKYRIFFAIFCEIGCSILWSCLNRSPFAHPAFLRGASVVRPPCGALIYSICFRRRHLKLVSRHQFHRTGHKPCISFRLLLTTRKQLGRSPCNSNNFRFLIHTARPLF